MENKINVAELLKDCPKGMELDCALFNNSVTLNKVADDDEFPITIETAKGDFVTLTKYGTYAETEEAKCVIFPKGKTTWEGFVPPCKFKDGDILVHTQNQRFIMSIYHKRITELIIKTHCILWDKDEGLSINMDICCYPDNTRLATEEEKARLFQAIKDNGYEWNEETKTLEKLVTPKFKVGDRIKNKNTGICDTVIKVYEDCYLVTTCLDEQATISFDIQDYWELVPNKFDINTLIPFESKVLVRNDESQYWIPAFWGCKRDDCYTTTFGWSKYCVPFAGNEHLFRTSDDCDEYFKTWK